MTTLLGIHSLTKSFGTQHLFTDLNFTICQGEKIGLVGPNGAGKTTLLEILIDQESPDKGYVTKKQGLRIGYAGQNPDFPALTLEEVMLRPFSKKDDIDLVTRARILLGKAQFTDFEQDASKLSGGWKKRLDLAAALMLEPDLLLLDEPTNHLDLEGILWLEKFLCREKTAYLIVSHDRYFLENVTNKIIEINKCYPQGLLICDGSMSAFLEQKELFLEGQAQQERGMLSVLRDETDWLKRSPKARTTKSQSRVKNAYKLMDDVSKIKNRNQVVKVDIKFSSSERETRKLLAVNNLCKSLGGKLLFKNVNLILSPGTRLGIVGKNGTGKTTLMKIMAKMLPQDMGTIKYADDLKMVYFDQHRDEVPHNLSLKDALGNGQDYVSYKGQRIHVNGWAKKFLFASERLNLPVGLLSGGERARILIAKLMLEDADILFLDEPTNDLDIQTLEVIEESLNEFPGAVVLITHDRCLMDRVCTQILGLGENHENEIFSGYEQWEAKTKEAAADKEEQTPKATPQQPKPVKSKKLSYHEQKELENMESKIMAVEELIDALHKKIEDPANAANSQLSLSLYTDLANAQKQLNDLFERWDHLTKESS